MPKPKPNDIPEDIEQTLRSMAAEPSLPDDDDLDDDEEPGPDTDDFDDENDTLDPSTPADDDAPLGASASSIPPQLSKLARVVTVDARKLYARVNPASWTLQVFEDSGVEPSEDETDPLAGFAKVFPRRKPVAHCTPDLLTFLQREGHTGDVAVVFYDPNAKGKKGEHLQFLHIPKDQPAPEPAPVAQPAQQAQPQYGNDALGMVNRMLDEMQRQRREDNERMERIISAQRESQRETMAAMLNRFDEMTTRLRENDPARDIGAEMIRANLEELKHKLTSRTKSPLKQVLDEISEAEEAKGALAKFNTEEKPKDELVEWLKEIGGPLIKAKLAGKMGVSPGALAANDPQTQEIVKTLNEMMTEGAQKLTG